MQRSSFRGFLSDAGSIPAISTPTSNSGDFFFLGNRRCFLYTVRLFENELPDGFTNQQLKIESEMKARFSEDEL